MHPELITRHEHPTDIDDVDRLVGEAFGGRPNEVALVRRLRGAATPISLVAVYRATVVGHAMLSVLALEAHHERVLGLAPVSVSPGYQGRGIGSRLTRDCLSVAEAFGGAMVVVLGDPAYYGRFGFVSASRHGIEPPAEVPSGSFMVVCFSAHDEGARGRIIYPAVFRETGTL